MPHRHVAPQRRAGAALGHVRLLLGAGQLQEDHQARRRRPQALQRAPSPGAREGRHRKDIREEPEGLGEEMERSHRERFVVNFICN